MKKMEKDTYNKIYDEIEAEIKGSMLALGDVAKVEVITRVMHDQGFPASRYEQAYNRLREAFVGRSL